jgi:hypothetical protein
MKQISIILIIFCSVLTGIAQESTPEWEVIVFAPSPEPTIYIVNAAGLVDSFAVPGVPYFAKVILSADRHFLLYGVINEMHLSDSLQLIDIENNQTKEILNSAIVTNFSGYESFAFSPDNQQIVATYVYYAENAGEYASPLYGEVLVDAETGEFEVQAEGSSIFASWSTEPIPSQRYIYTVEGNSPVPFREISGTVRLPNQEERLTRTMVLTPYGGIHDTGETLITGEHIVSSFISSIDMNGAETGFYSPMVRYQTDDFSYPVWVDMSACNPFGYDCSALDHNFIAHWVMDGQYIYTHPNILVSNPNYNEFQLLARDDTLSYFQLEGFYQFIAGTPDGWLMHFIGDRQSIVHFRFENGELIETTLLELPNRTEIIQLVEKPFLGASLENPQAFPEVPVPRTQG